MVEYIEREAAHRMMVHLQRYSWTSPVTAESHITVRADDVNFGLDKIPTADVAPVAHGRWENGCSICPICGVDKFSGLDADVWSDWKPKYCPNCGAKMDKEELNCSTTS